MNNNTVEMNILASSLKEAFQSANFDLNAEELAKFCSSCPNGCPTDCASGCLEGCIPGGK